MTRRKIARLGPATPRQPRPSRGFQAASPAARAHRAAALPWQRLSQEAWARGARPSAHRLKLTHAPAMPSIPVAWVAEDDSSHSYPRKVIETYDSPASLGRATRAVGAPCLAARCGPPASPPAQALFGFISLVCMPLCACTRCRRLGCWSRRDRPSYGDLLGEIARAAGSMGIRNHALNLLVG